MQTDKKKPLKIILAFAAVYIIWGTTYLAIRVAVQTIPPFFMAGTRFVIAGGLMYLFLRARGAPPPQRFHWPAAIIVGALLLGGGSGLVTWSEQTIPSSVAALVIATVPLWITLFDMLIYKAGRPDKKVIAGLLLGFLGILLLLGPDQLMGTADFNGTALLILIISPILWSFGSLYSRQARLPQNVFMATAMEMLAGGIVLLIAGLVTGEAARLDLAAISTSSWLSMIYLFLFGSIVAFTAYIWLLKTVTASKAATYSYVNPIIAVFLGWLILSEPITPIMIAAMLIIIIAVVLITTRQPRQVTSKKEMDGRDKSPSLFAQPAIEASESNQPILPPHDPAETAVSRSD
jgi:drug/metabolite transporter (DMT)-like permease